MFPLSHISHKNFSKDLDCGKLFPYKTSMRRVKSDPDWADIGNFADPAADAGSGSPLMDGDEQIGLVLRTRTGVRPVFASIGHRIDLKSAAELAMACMGRYRNPEPIRQADIEVGRLKVNVR
jgi:hypothetical protein